MPSNPRRASTARWRALRWFHDYEIDRNSVMHRPVPTKRMELALMRDGLLRWSNTSLRGLPKMTLTVEGEALLATKHQRLSPGPARRSASPPPPCRSPEHPDGTGQG